MINSVAASRTKLCVILVSTISYPAPFVELSLKLNCISSYYRGDTKWTCCQLLTFGTMASKNHFRCFMQFIRDLPTLTGTFDWIFHLFTLLLVLLNSDSQALLSEWA